MIGYTGCNKINGPLRNMRIFFKTIYFLKFLEGEPLSSENPVFDRNKVFTRMIGHT